MSLAPICCRGLSYYVYISIPNTFYSHLLTYRAETTAEIRHNVPSTTIVETTTTYKTRIFLFYFFISCPVHACILVKGDTRWFPKVSQSWQNLRIINSINVVGDDKSFARMFTFHRPINPTSRPLNRPNYY